MRSTIVSTILAASLTGAAFAGSLTPPGAPSATMKTLDEIEPRIPIGPLTTPGDADSVYRIAQPGSYYLTDHVNVTLGKRGIEIASDDVTLDLGGFTVRGIQNGTFEGIAAIAAGSTRKNISVGNGVVTNVSGPGVQLFDSEGAIVHDMRIDSTGADGLVAGFGGVVERVTVVECAGDGFNASNGTVFRDCNARQNGIHGFVGRMTASGCTASDNGGAGFNGNGSFENCLSSSNDLSGFFINAPSNLTGCTAISNLTDGFVASNEPSIALNCIASNNGDAGFYDTNNGAWLATSCAANENGEQGFWGNVRGRLVQCSAVDNGSHGFYMRGGAVVGSHSRTNGGDGVRAFSSHPVTVADCTVESNSSHGVIITSDADNSVVRGNAVSGHTAANVGIGIRVESNANFVLIDGNVTSENLVGIQVLTADNTVINNLMTSNINAPIGAAAGNDIAPLSTAAAATSPLANIFN
ncbi:MAG: right-handed parallel beta-helix repeat-containing protein [Phycisphaerales bacterium]